MSGDARSGSRSDKRKSRNRGTSAASSCAIATYCSADSASSSVNPRFTSKLTPPRPTLVLPLVHPRDDEEMLARLHQAELACLALDERRRFRLLDALLERCVRALDVIDLRLLRGYVGGRVPIGPERLDIADSDGEEGKE